MKKLYVLFAMAFTVLLLGVVNTHAMGLLETPKQPIALFVQLDPNHVGKPVEISEELYTKVNEKLWCWRLVLHQLKKKLISGLVLEKI